MMRKLEQVKMHRRDVLHTMLVSMFLLSALMINVCKVQSATEVSIQPSSQSVGQEGVLLPTSPFAINITVSNVNDLYAWQIVLHYNSTILKQDTVTLPSGHVFEGKQFQQMPTVNTTDSKGRYILLSATLLGSESTFSGSGVLCQIKFLGQARGVSSLSLDIAADLLPDQREPYRTYLLDSTITEISPVTINNGQVNVAGVEKLKAPSKITISVSPISVITGSNVTISGEINVTRSNLEVILYYRVAQSTTWFDLATNRTDANGHYTYTWNTNAKPDVYELNATWFGDADYKGAESNIVTITVSKMMSTISIGISSLNVTAGSTVVINGTVAPRGGTAEVTILYRQIGGTWTTLSSATTTLESAYRYSWQTAKAGSFELKSKWEGDDHTNGAESEVKTVEVTGGAQPPGGQSPDIMDYLPYIIAAIAIIAIVAIGIYFTKIKKR